MESGLRVQAKTADQLKTLAAAGATVSAAGKEITSMKAADETAGVKIK